MAPSVMLAVTLAHLLISCTCGLMDNTAPESCSATQLLTVNGCPVFVHDVTGAKDFEVEPLMCVTQSLSNVRLQIDPLTEHMFVSIPVMIRDEAMRAEIDNQLQNLSPNSVKFATVSKISVSMDASSKHVRSLMFLWSPDEPVAYLRLGCPKGPKDCNQFFLNLNVSIFDAISWVTATATIKMGTKQTELNYKLMVQNQNLFNPQFYGSNFECRSNCDDLQFLQTVSAGKCIARVYQSQDSNDIFYIEPLLCPNSSVANESIKYDYSRDMHYLKLNVVLQDGVTLNAVQNELANLSVANISYMQLSQVNIVLSSLLSRRFDIGPLMVSGDWSSGQMRVYCKTEDDCRFLRSHIIANPLSFWSHVKFELTSHIPNKCIVKSTRPFYNIRLTDVSEIWQLNSQQEFMFNLDSKYPEKTVDGKKFVIIQQRLTNSTSFARNWNEYEAGFGDATNFWIGLSRIHSLSINGVTFRMEMKLKDGSEQHQEYEGFKVGDASTNYTMTCGRLIGSRSTGSNDAMATNSGMMFSTWDRDNDMSSTSCSIGWGNSGWWYNSCGESDPNNVYGTGMSWTPNGDREHPREIRLMLQI